MARSECYASLWEWPCVVPIDFCWKKLNSKVTTRCMLRYKRIIYRIAKRLLIKDRRSNFTYEEVSEIRVDESI